MLVYPISRPRRWLRWFLAYVAGVLAFMVIGLTVQAALSRQQAPATFTYTVPTPPWASAAPSASPKAAAKASASPSRTAPLSGPLTLTAGRETVNGVELGFPHSTAGAVSAAADAAGEVFSTLDPDRAAAVMRLVAGQSYTGAAQQAAQGAVSDRRFLGLPAAGTVPAGYSVVVQPQEYQARSVSAGSVLVLLLCDFTTSRPGAGTQTRTGVFPFPVHWADADWKVTDPGSASYLSLAAEPFSAQAASLGWQELLPQGANG